MTLFDFSQVLKVVEGDKDMAFTLLDMFTLQSKEDFEQLIKAFDNNDIPTVGQIAHKMKSSLSTLGMMETSDLMKSIELGMLEGKSKDELAPSINLANEQLNEIYAEMNKLV